jgi:hypothetical protein
MYDKHAKQKNAEETAARRAAKRQKHMSTREQALMCPAPEGVMEILRRLHKNKNCWQLKHTNTALMTS